MSQSVTLKARGLYSFPNSLSEIPEGSLIQADNVVIDREGVISPRRGFAVYGGAMGTSTNRAKQLLTYKGRVLRHWANTIDYDSDGSGTFASLSTNVTEVAAGSRIKYVEANGNFYFTTSSGIKKISAFDATGLSTATVTNAGGVKALDGTGKLNSQLGFFTQDSRVAYRIVWGIRDANNNVILGSPSQRIVVDNPLVDLLIGDFNTLVGDLATAAAADAADALSDTNYTTLKISMNSGASTVLAGLKVLASGASCKLDTDLGGTTFQTLTVPTDPTIPATTTQLLAIQAYFDAIVTALNSHPGISTTAKAAIGGAFQSSTQSATVDLTFTVPSDVTASHFYQVYRSALATSTNEISIADIAPDDELRLVYEDNPTSGQLISKQISYHDIVPQDFRDGGANLYTNANSGEGITQANEPPPLAKDIVLFKGFTFFANTQTRHKKQISLLTATGLGGGTFTVTQSGVSTTFTFVDKVAQVTQITCVSGSNYIAAGTADYFDIYSAENADHYRVWFQVGSAVAPSGTGVTLVPVSILNTDTNAQVATKLQAVLHPMNAFTATVSSNVVTVTNENTGYTNSPTENVANAGFTISVTTSGSGEDATNKKVAVSDAATPGQEVDETARSLVKVINEQASAPVYAYYLSGTEDVPGQVMLEARAIGTSPFYITSSAGITAKFNPSLPTSGTAVASDNEISANRIYYSKQQQPEAVPIVNYQDVGPKDKRILRILPLRDSLFILSESGVYRLSGDTAAAFTVALFDGTTKILAPDTAAVLNNQIYMFADQGIVTISDTGVSVISRPIEDQLRALPQYTNFATASFAVSYDTDRSYLLWTVKAPTDTVATQCFRYNTFTNTWVTWSIAKTCGVVPPESNILYLGPTDINNIEKERKSYSRLDHADRDTTITLTTNGVNGTTIRPITINGATAGDVLVQTQYLTVAQFNRVLNKLDADTGPAFDDYVATLQAVPGSEMRSKVTALAQKLDLDANVVASDFAASIATYDSSFSGAQSAFNVIVSKLNSDSGCRFKNYKPSTGTVEFEVVISSIVPSPASIAVRDTTPFIQGDIVLYKHITSSVVWAPNHFGDASMTKHVREATMLFETMAFTSATAAYSSDLSPGFTSIDFNGDGSGVWGGFLWGQATWGGEGTSRPFRTYIPADKQRCRYINTKFTHGTALEKYAIFGISYTLDGVSSRGYR